MQHEEFDKIVLEELERLKNVLYSKNEGYAIDSDRLHNFRQAAALQGVTVKEALAGFMCKHTISLYDMIGNGKEYTMEEWNEKIGDHSVYLIILKAVIVEEFKQNGVDDSLLELKKKLES